MKEDGTAQSTIDLIQRQISERAVRNLRDYQLAAVKAANEASEHTLIVLPTGAGKSHVIGGICATNTNSNVLIISHVKEILEQNAEKLMEYVPTQRVGIYSSGLGQRRRSKYCVAGIQSIYKKAAFFKKYDIILIDEAHMIPPDGEGRYVSFLKEVDPKKVIGLTATPFRLKSGHLIDGPLFKSVAYTADVRKLIEQGYLCNLTSKATETSLDVQNVKVVAGDYNKRDLSLKLDQNSITNRIVEELVDKHTNRKSWLVFAIDIAHAEHVAAALQAKGIVAATVHSQMLDDRSPYLQAFKRGEIQALVSIETLTTGFDAPNVDLIALLRPTQSPVLHIQMIGRGLRPAPNKENCLVLDFAGNIARLGPIDDVEIIKDKIKGQGDAPTKRCPECDELLACAVRTCPDCGFEFPAPKTKLELQASREEILGSRKKVHEYEVMATTYHMHLKRGTNTPMMRVTYRCGLKFFHDYICFEHVNYPRLRAERWWQHRSTAPIPNTVEEALLSSRTLRKPTHIFVTKQNGYDTVIRHIFEEQL